MAQVRLFVVRPTYDDRPSSHPGATDYTTQSFLVDNRLFLIYEWINAAPNNRTSNRK